MDHLSGLATEVLLSVLRIFHHELRLVRLPTELPTRMVKCPFFGHALPQPTTSSLKYIVYTRTVLPCNVTLASTIWQAAVMSWLSSDEALMRMGRLLGTYGRVPVNSFVFERTFPVVHLFRTP